ncbi:MAG: hypothetical protein JXB62_07205 [Pirellulales bacterium]|nr:hypothetical protein [Pirellulales bacterium]
MSHASVLIRLAGTCLLTLCLAGCSSSSGDPDGSAPPEKPVAGIPPDDFATPPSGGAALSGRASPPASEPAEPTVDPSPRPTVEPIAAPDAPDKSSNPLRDDTQPPVTAPVEGASAPVSPQRTPSDPAPSDPAPSDTVPSDTVPAESTSPKSPMGKAGRAPFDPIKENGAIFVGWPAEAQLALVITGRQWGYIEPCGCAGLDRMKGGMSRRYTLFSQLRQRGWPVVGIDVGGLAKGFGRQAVLKFHTMVEGMRKMGYEAIALGTSELQLPTGELAADAASVEGQPSRFLSANAAMFGFATNMTAKTRIVETGGRKLGITAVLGKQFQKLVQDRDTIELTDPETALAATVPQLKQQADYLILLAHATKEESVALGEKFPDFDLVVTAGGAPTPPGAPQQLNGGRTLLIEVGEKGMDAVVLAMFDDPQQPVRYQRVPLDSRFPASPEMELLLTVYEDQLQREWLTTFALPKIPHEQAELNGKFVGSKQCESCHEISYQIWKKSGHAKAFDTLAQLKPVRTFDPECVSCHVIGWHPQEYFPYLAGFVTQQQTPELVDVGCESCHGPGGAHTAAELGGDEALKKKLQAAMVVTKAEAQQNHCHSCHDLDNSPDFDFETYWPQVEHYEDVDE